MTVTGPDGCEHIRLVGIDGDQRRKVNAALEKALDDVAGIIGSPNRAQNALLALLGERLLAEHTDIDENIPIVFSERRSRHG